MQNNDPPFDIARLDAAFHLRAIGSRLLMRVPFGVPEWDWRQKRLLTAWLLGTRVRFSAAPCARDLEAELCRVFGAKFSIATGSGREAIKLALMGLDVQPGERVVLPSFCCFSVLLPVLELGLEPVLADVGEDLQIDPASVRRVIRSGDRALIVPHLFGGLADMPQLVEIARANGAAVIDDAAQAIGRQSDWGWAGCGGDVGIFSFGLFKPLNALGGGALLTDDERLYTRARQTIAGIPFQAQGRATVLRTLLKVVLRKVSYRVFLYHRLRQQRTENSTPLGIQRNNCLTPIAPLNARLAASQLSLIATRRQQAGRKAYRYTESLSTISGIEVPGRGKQDGYPRLAVRLTGGQSKDRYHELFAGMLREGIEVQPTYRPLHRLLREMGREPEAEFALSETLAEQVMCLPFSPDRAFSPVMNALQKLPIWPHSCPNHKKRPSWR